MKIVADEKIPYLQGALEPRAEMVYLPGDGIRRADLMDADALITRTRTRCNRDLLAGTKVKFIASATAGYDHIDARACQELGIQWTNAPGCNADSVVEYVASALLTLAAKKPLDLSFRVLGVVGCGQVGSRIARMAAAFGLRVLLNDPPRARVEGPRGFVDLAQIQAEADIITFHVSLNTDGEDKTVHLIDRSFLRGLAKPVLLINASRGEVADTNALLDAIGHGAFHGVVLDVFENEPGINRDLLDRVDIGTPHIAGYSADGKLNGTMQTVQSISRFFNLGLDDWLPSGAPMPKKPLLTIDCAGRSDLDILQEAVFYAYQVLDDDRRLRESPETFEQQRGQYPIRRNFGVYTIALKNDRNQVAAKLRALAFQVVNA